MFFPLLPCNGFIPAVFFQHLLFRGAAYQLRHSFTKPALHFFEGNIGIFHDIMQHRGVQQLILTVIFSRYPAYIEQVGMRLPLRYRCR